jgi:hypothetical protein
MLGEGLAVWVGIWAWIWIDEFRVRPQRILDFAVG